MSRQFQRTGSLSPRKSAFDLSYRKLFTCDMGQLIPVMCDEVVPGDIFKIGAETVLRFQPLVAPILHEVNLTIHYFFVPYRLLDDNWETFITGGVDGRDNSSLPLWPNDGNKDLHSLWDYFGFPIVPGSALQEMNPMTPMAYPLYAYNLVYNEYYRDENLQDEVALTQTQILNRNWTKDYFTSALPFQLRGAIPALPVFSDLDIDTNAVFQLPEYNTVPDAQNAFPIGLLGLLQADSGWENNLPIYGSPSGSGNAVSLAMPFSNLPDETFGLISVNHMSASMASALGTPSFNQILTLYNKVVAQATGLNATFDVSDIRLAFQLQKWRERNARAGVRYTEFLKAHYGVSPSDSRLQRPEYIGGVKSPITVSEVLSTFQFDTGAQPDSHLPQGNMAGHGLAASSGYVGSCHVQEFGLIIGLLSVMPKPAYEEGMPYQWLRRLPQHFYSPEFAHLSERGIMNGELVCTFQSPSLPGQGTVDTEIFGYQGIYDEMRVKNDMVCSEMRVKDQNGLSYWHLSRYFGQTTNLNSDFITCRPDKRIFAVTDVHGLIVNVGNKIKAIRPLPEIAEPGLIDHY